MTQLNRFSLIALLLTALLLAVAGTVQAQTDERGSISGAVYLDVNGDGQSVETGVTGEDPVEGVTIEFVSSDEATVVTLTTAENGTYGLAAAGQSYWRVTAKPDAAKYLVTSENPLFAPVFPADGLVQTGYNFCLSTGTNAVIILPESGAAATESHHWVWVTAVFGLGLVGIGLFLELKRRAA